MHRCVCNRYSVIVISDYLLRSQIKRALADILYGMAVEVSFLVQVSNTHVTTALVFDVAVLFLN